MAKKESGMKRFWAEESKEKAHKDIKKTLEKKAGMKKNSKKSDPKPAKHGIPFKGEKESAKPVKKFIEKRMHEFKKGEMHSRIKGTGPKVTNPKQALAIALSESRAKGAKIPKKKSK